ncbi:MAG: PQQ-like beta-propeller repeat protein, partial [Anaerolineae bacterium]|nr:PQQ-like beta-propeller repeat protein [Anaerolineae bacterium]
MQVDPPYCVAWKWYQVPLSGRSQPVVGNGVLYMGSMNGKLYARDARTGAPKWEFAADGPIRHTAGVLVGSIVGGNGLVVFSTYNGLNGSTYALDASTGVQSGSARPAPAPLPRCCTPRGCGRMSPAPTASSLRWTSKPASRNGK